MTQNTPSYVCTELVTHQGVLICKTWQELSSQPVPSSITKEQANQITVNLMVIISLAFGWFIIIKLVRSFK